MEIREGKWLDEQVLWRVNKIVSRSRIATKYRHRNMCKSIHTHAHSNINCVRFNATCTSLPWHGKWKRVDTMFNDRMKFPLSLKIVCKQRSVHTLRNSFARTHILAVQTTRYIVAFAYRASTVCVEEKGSGRAGAILEFFVSFNGRHTARHQWYFTMFMSRRRCPQLCGMSMHLDRLKHCLFRLTKNRIVADFMRRHKYFHRFSTRVRGHCDRCFSVNLNLIVSARMQICSEAKFKWSLIVAYAPTLPLFAFIHFWNGK